ncbi:MAG TPA: DUF3883 domain-containing protein [Luteibacter sp.]|uniref:DUF3883 domain-containing protein n=1 Tax=Luteibacter sp. TaxID=1886636 RepID=UPI002C35890B|nr:DUF3883 domain-containing protein [Luteibacter sp.]HVI55868.1 DUF3883 domain-containing protein [Luteibacter sp.]
MAVFIVPAANRAAQENYAKTLTSPVSSERRRALPSDLVLPEADVYAWGFPRNEGNRELWAQMIPGDVCLFYAKIESSGEYCWAARVNRTVEEGYATAASSAFWDNDEFLPYFIDKPIRIKASTGQLAASLAHEANYMASHPLSSMRLADEKRASRAIAEFGSFDDWVVEFVRAHSIDSLAGNEVERYFSAPPPVETGQEIEYATNLFKPVMKRVRGSLISAPSQSRRLSLRAKMIGDAGELATIEHLRVTLPPSQAATVRWVANDGQTPGWDIEHLDEHGQLVRIEVKSTVGETFPSFDMTANELYASEQHGPAYHLYLVANCLSPGRRRLQVVRDPYKEFAGLFVPSVYRVGFASPR